MFSYVTLYIISKLLLQSFFNIFREEREEWDEEIVLACEEFQQTLTKLNS